MKKLMIVSLVAAAGLTVAACKQEATTGEAANTAVVDETAALNGTTDDSMGDVNAVAGADANAVAAPAANETAAPANAM